jgi:transglutaminase-like putative cysteine protease
MSGLLSRPAPATAGAGTTTWASAPVAAGARDSLAVRLAVFAALALYGASHWAMLVEDPDGGRTLLVVIVATAGAAALALLGRLSLPRPAVHGLAALVALAVLCLGLMAAGLPARLLAPGHWNELFDGLDRGLAGVQGVDWPYDGPDEWIRLTILLGIPFLVGLAAVIGFWPARRAAPVLRALALVVLLVLYGTAVTEHDPEAPLLRGLGLLLLVAGWLWLPRMPPREAGAGVAAVVAVGVLSLPLAAALDGDRPWWDYRAWTLFGGGKAITFDWSHQYGPLDWPREGTTLLNVRSDRPHYWKADVLDGFDGFRWVRTRMAATTDISDEVPQRPQRGLRWQNFEYNQAWQERIRFTVRSLSSDLMVTAGNTRSVEGVDAVLFSNGSGRISGEPLEKGDSYEITTYAPDPSADQMRAAEPGYPDDLVAYTSLFLPRRGESALRGVGRQGDAARTAADGRNFVEMPLRGEPDSGTPGSVERVRRSRYAKVYRLANRLTAGAPTGYAAVKAIERHLQDEYLYSEQVPSADLPLNSFLFEEKRGYCQQFSGAMALMLRMVGIPVRVVAGFSPGSYNRDTGEFRVRDLDAHSWVEVYFTGIGWVPFDPTPAIAPADSQSSGVLATSAARGDAGEISGGSRSSSALSERGTNVTAAASDDGGAGWVLPALLVLVLVVTGGAALLMGIRVRRRRGLTPAELTEAQVVELRRALERLGWAVPATTTLMGLERRLRRASGPHAAAYAGALRAHRFQPGGQAPGLGERRALRRELSDGGGLAARLRGLLAIPPGGPIP